MKRKVLKDAPIDGGVSNVPFKALDKEEAMKFTERKRVMFFGLPWTFTTYTITNEYITINSGLIRHEENDAYMYKVIDVKLERSFWERVFGLGTVYCYGGDVTNPTLILKHIKNAKEIKNFILEASEDMRIKRRTLNTMDVAGGFDAGASAGDCDCGVHHME